MAKKLTKEQKAGLLARTKTIYTDKDGNVIYMPCSTHEEYEQRLSDYNGSD